MSNVNLSGSLFMLDEKLTNDNNVFDKLDNSAPYAWNAIQQIDGTSGRFPAYVNQSRLSTYYQDNPWDTLLANTAYVPLSGGPLNPNTGSGSKPRNISEKTTKIVDKQLAKLNTQIPTSNTVKPVNVAGIFFPSFMIR